MDGGKSYTFGKIMLTFVKNLPIFRWFVVGPNLEL
jgi:hypothetical protein